MRERKVRASELFRRSLSRFLLNTFSLWAQTNCREIVCFGSLKESRSSFSSLSRSRSLPFIFPIVIETGGNELLLWKRDRRAARLRCKSLIKPKVPFQHTFRQITSWLWLEKKEAAHYDALEWPPHWGRALLCEDILITKFWFVFLSKKSNSVSQNKISLRKYKQYKPYNKL